jgi:hypothetical protein
MWQVLKILHYYEHVYFHLNRSMSANTIEGGILTIKKISGSWRFSRQDIDGWIKQQSMQGLNSRANNQIEPLSR